MTSLCSLQYETCHTEVEDAAPEKAQGRRKRSTKVSESKQKTGRNVEVLKSVSSQPRQYNNCRTGVAKGPQKRSEFDDKLMSDREALRSVSSRDLARDHSFQPMQREHAADKEASTINRKQAISTEVRSKPYARPLRVMQSDEFRGRSSNADKRSSSDRCIYDLSSRDRQT